MQVDDNISSIKAIQDLVNYFRRAFGGRDVCLNGMIVGFLQLMSACRAMDSIVETCGVIISQNQGGVAGSEQRIFCLN